MTNSHRTKTSIYFIA